MGFDALAISQKMMRACGSFVGPTVSLLRRLKGQGFAAIFRLKFTKGHAMFRHANQVTQELTGGAASTPGTGTPKRGKIIRDLGFYLFGALVSHLAPGTRINTTHGPGTRMAATVERVRIGVGHKEFTIRKTGVTVLAVGGKRDCHDLGALLRYVIDSCLRSVGGGCGQFGPNKVPIIWEKRHASACPLAFTYNSKADELSVWYAIVRFPVGNGRRFYACHLSDTERPSEFFNELVCIHAPLLGQTNNSSIGKTIFFCTYRVGLSNVPV